MNNDNNIDNYEPYYEGIRIIHEGVFNELLHFQFVRKETQMFLLQCNYQEYISYGHDKNYEWFRLCFNNNELRDFALGVNKVRFINRKIEINNIIKQIKKAWLHYCHSTVEIIGNINDISSLKKDPYEMILSVHFWFDKMLIDDGILDSQYIKIIYTGNSINCNIDKIKGIKKILK